MKKMGRLLNNKGLSLVELIATVAIMAIVSVGIGTAIVSTTKSYSSGNGEVNLQQEAQNITNIINNLIIDATFASNEQGNTNVLIVENTDDDFYRLELNAATHTLSYMEITPELPDDDYAAYKAFIADTTGTEPSVGYTVGESYELSKNVNKFNAVPGTTAVPGSPTGEWDFTVKFDLGFEAKTAGVANTRNMSTSFLTTSRNGEAYKEYTEVDGAVIVVDNEIIVEPNQNFEGANGIPFEVLFSGDKSSAAVWVEFDNVSTGSSAYYTGTVDTEKKINVKIGADQVSPIIAKIHAKVGSTEVSTTVEVKVRRVNGINSFTSPTVTGTYAKASSTYEFRPTLTVQNGDRFYALPMDDNYVTPYMSKIELDKSYSGNVTFKIYKVSDNSLVDTKVNTGFNIDYRENYFTVSINEDLERGDSIVIRTIATHAGNSRTGTDANNKSGIKYDFVSAEYPIELGLFPNANFHRGSEFDMYYNINMEEIKTDNILNAYINSYLESKETQVNADFAAYISSPSGSWILSGRTYDQAKQAWMEWILLPQLKNKLNGKVYSAPFYSIGYKSSLPYDDFRNTFTTPDKNNSYITYEPTGVTEEEKKEDKKNYRFDWSVGYYWSQYRPLGGIKDDGTFENSNTRIAFQDDKSSRLDADKEYSVEFVDVLFINEKVELLSGDSVGDDSNKKIIWPYYPKLISAGFGNAGYSLDASAESVTSSYSSFANHFEVGKATMQFKADSLLGIPSGAISVGTETSPLYFGSMLGVGNGKDIEYDNWDNWEGLGHNMFINHNSYSIDAYYGSTPAWHNLVAYRMKTDGDFTSSLGGFSVGCTDHSFFFKKENFTYGTTDSSAIFKMTCSLRDISKSYILDSDGVFSNKIYYDTNKYNYNYPDGDGVIYFKMY